MSGNSVSTCRRGEEEKAREKMAQTCLDVYATGVGSHATAD